MKTLVALLLALALPLAGQTATTSTATGNASINQTFASGQAGQGRITVAPVQPYQAPTQAYLGPWGTGANVLDDLRALPEVITYEQAKRMYKGGVSSRINRMADGHYEYNACRLINHLPLKLVRGDDGKEYYAPDESRFERKAFISLQGDGKATTLDVVAKAVIEALDSGANSILILKKVTGQETSTSGWGIGLGGVTGSLGGGEGLTKSQAGSAGTGYNHATAKPVYSDGLMVLAVYADGKPDPLPTPVAPTRVVEPAQPQPQAKVTTPKALLSQMEVHFAMGDDRLSQEARVVVKKLANSLKPGSKVLVGGFTSAEGSQGFNEALSLRRAEAVTKALLEEGVRPEQIAQAGKTRQGLPSNRRVEITTVTLDVQ